MLVTNVLSDTSFGEESLKLSFFEGEKEQNMGRPIVEHFDTSIFLNSVINAVDLFSVVDPNGDAIMHYDIEDYQADPTGGFFRVNGIAVANGTQFRVAAEDLGNVEYVAG